MAMAPTKTKKIMKLTSSRQHQARARVVISLTFALHEDAAIQFEVALIRFVLLLLVTLGLVNRSFFVLLLDLRLAFFRVRFFHCLLICSTLCSFSFLGSY